MARLQFSFKTDPGAFPGKGDDSFFYENNLFIVAEGVGGEYLDHIAQGLTCQVIYKSFFSALEKNISPTDALLYALKEANRELLIEGKQIGKKVVASVSVAYVREKIVYFSHLGDTRIYCLQKGEILQLTRDHTVPREDSQQDSRSRNTRRRRPLTEALGLHETPPIEVKKFALNERDLLLMTTEGLTSRLSDMQILKTSLKTNNAKKLSVELLSEARRIDRERSMTLGLLGLEPQGPVRLKFLIALAVILFPAMGVIAFWNMSFEKVGITEQVSVMAPSPPVSQEEGPPNIPEKTETLASQSPPAAPATPDIEKEGEQQKIPLQKEISEFLLRWTRAWEKTAGTGGNMEHYMSFYAEGFSSGSFTKSLWGRDKEKKNRKKQWILVAVQDLKIMGSPTNERVVARFTQHYKSSNFSVRSGKEVVLIKEKGGWKILTERTL